MKKRMMKQLCAALLLPLAACAPDQAMISGEGAQADLVNAYLDAVDERYAYEIAETLAYDPEYLSNSLGFRTAGSDARTCGRRLYRPTDGSNRGLRWRRSRSRWTAGSSMTLH